MLDICLFGETARNLRVPFSDPFSHLGNCGPGVATTLTVDLTHWVKKAMGSALRPTPWFLSLKGGHRGRAELWAVLMSTKPYMYFPRKNIQLLFLFLFNVHTRMRVLCVC